MYEVRINRVLQPRLLLCNAYLRPIQFWIIVLTIACPFSTNFYPQNTNITFEHFSIDQGMYETNINSVIQDKTGFLWFGTWGGIEKYDGYNFTAYKQEPDNPNSINNQFVNTLYEDKEGNIWIGTRRGIEKFNKTTGVFKHFKPHPPNNETESNNNVLSICEDKQGILWVGTEDGLNKFDKNSGKFISISNDNKDPESISSNNVNAIYEDKTGSLWVGTGKGLDKLDRKSGKFVHFWFDPNNKSEWSNYWVNTIFEDNSGILWLGTREGVIAFDQKAETFTPYIKEKGNSISSICEDESGHIWFGSWESGLYSFDKKTKKFTHYLHNDNDPGSLSSNTITSICSERSGTIWIGTRGGGVNKINRTKQPFKKYLFDEVYNIVKGNNDMLWIGTSKGWYKFYPKTEQIIPYSFGKDFLVSEEESGGLWIGKPSGGIYKRDVKGSITNFYDSSGRELDKNVNCLCKTPDGNIWIGTVGGGVYKIDPNTNLITKILQAVNSIFDFCLDSSGLLWIGSMEGGLICYDPAKNMVVKNYIYDPGNPESIKCNVVLSILEDKTGALYLGTNNGLGIYNRSTKKFNFFDERNGLPHNVVWWILNDDRGNYWLSTRKGISKFNTNTKQFQNYDVSYGLPENGFYMSNGCKTENGEMYFGSPNAVVRFHPDSIKNNPFIPPIVITTIKEFDQPVSFRKEINLSYNENFLSFEFIALSYISPERNQYAHKMEGVDKDWVYSGTRRFASYPNLEPGEYIFRVKGSNNDGVWNEEGTSIAIIISPPFWKTWWAYTAYASVLILALYGIRRYEMNRLSLKNQVKVERAVLKEREETDKIKSRFFANISHEFRTPLTLILGPAEKIISDTSDDIKKDANIIKRNSRRLLQLINQLLDLSRLEAGKLKLEASKGNIVSFVKGVALSFESLAESKDITLKIQPEKDFIELYFDREKMMKILTNILSNAFKFTPEEGIVTVSIKECHSELVSESLAVSKMLKQVQHDNTKEFVEIKIRDTGIGIAQAEIPKLFDRFYQVDSSFTKEHEGTGIGLALTKELVELHHGIISVESKQGEWSEFTVSLPEGKNHLADDEIIKVEKTETAILPAEQETYTSLPNKNADDSIAISIDDNGMKEQLEEKTIILIVEDNYDMREYIKESLGNGYHIEEAVNGEQGVRKAEKIIPDLIISDMMMPKMDGNELTRILKNDEKTCHIPIILLTARSGQENKIEGLQTGADDYLTKPFDTKELQIRIKNLIALRKKLQEKFSKFVIHPPVVENKKLSSYDEKFMFKVMEVIEKHISDEEFSIEEFGNEVGMSRTQFHRKFKAITGKPASMFLRSLRLTRAKKKIEEQQGNISEIAYSVGFSSPSYFTKCFREEFGFPPSDLVN
jgi:signal transduction histidine kinase/ligand-binding sensor domain-containing protein/DNA-binding response OmpR family regulator